MPREPFQRFHRGAYSSGTRANVHAPFVAPTRESRMCRKPLKRLPRRQTVETVFAIRRPPLILPWQANRLNGLGYPVPRRTWLNGSFPVQHHPRFPGVAIEVVFDV